jgi:hypothetical protein
MSKEEFKVLKEDIQANGLRVPIMIYGGQILDGRHRHKALMDIKVPLTENHFTEWKSTAGDTPLKYVISQNVARRHLNESQRAIIAAELANGTHGGDRSKTPIDALPMESAAKMLNVGKKSVERAKKALANPRLADEVRKGTIKVSAANNFAESDKQDELLKKHNNDIVEAVKEANQNTDTLATTLWRTLKSKFETVKKLDDLEATIKVLSDNLATYLKAQKELAETDKKAA